MEKVDFPNYRHAYFTAYVLSIKRWLILQYSLLYGEFRNEMKKGKTKVDFPRQEFEQNMFYSGKSPSNLLPYFGLIDKRMRYFDKD